MIPIHWAPRNRLGSSSELPPRPPILLPLTTRYHQRRLGVFFMEWYWHFILGEPEFLQLPYARYTQLPRRGGGVLSMTRYK